MEGEKAKTMEGVEYFETNQALLNSIFANSAVRRDFVKQESSLGSIVLRSILFPTASIDLSWPTVPCM